MDDVKRNALIQVLGPQLAAKLIAMSGQQTTKAVGDGMQAAYKVIEPPGPFNGSLKRLNNVLEAARAALPDTDVIKWMDGAAGQWQAKLMNGRSLGPKLTDSGPPSTKASADAPWVAARPGQLRRNADTLAGWLMGNGPSATDPHKEMDFTNFTEFVVGRRQGGRK